MKNIIKLSSLVFAVALGSAATAAADSTVQSQYLTVPVGGNFYAGNYNFSFTLTDNDLSTITDGLVLAIYWGKVGSSGVGYASTDNANAFYFKKESDGVKLAVGEGTLSPSTVPTADFKTGGSPTPPTFTASTSADRYITTVNTLSAGTYSVSVVGANQSQTVTMKKGNDTISFTGGKGNAAYNGNMNGQLSGNMNTAVNLSYIPEPSAFGLLAGAGALALVAARRRRRAIFAVGKNSIND